MKTISQLPSNLTILKSNNVLNMKMNILMLGLGVLNFPYPDLRVYAMSVFAKSKQIYHPLTTMYQPQNPGRRPTLLPSQSHAGAPRRSTIAPSTLKSRQLAHLNAQIAQLQANMSDLDNLLRVTAVQAEYIRKLGILHGSL